MDASASVLSIIGRVTAAILATTVGAAFLGSVVLVSVFAYMLEKPSGGIPTTWAIIFLWGLFFAFIPALALGLLFELPFAWIVGARSGLLTHVVASAVFGASLLIALAWWRHTSSPIGRFEGVPLMAIIGALGGVCSALAWWRFVIRYW